MAGLFYCMCFFALAVSAYGGCDVKPQPTNFTPGKISGRSCQDVSSREITAAQCAMMCLYTQGYQGYRCAGASFSCLNETCQCLLCDGFEEVDFSAMNTSFYLNGRVLGQNVNIPPFKEFALEGGLVVGQIIRASLKLLSGKTTLQFMIPPQDIPMLIDMRSFNGQVVRNLFLLGEWGSEEVNDMTSTIASGKEINFLCIVRADAFIVYFDSTFVFKFDHRSYDFSSMTIFKVMGEGDLGKVKSFVISP